MIIRITWVVGEPLLLGSSFDSWEENFFNYCYEHSRARVLKQSIEKVEYAYDKWPWDWNLRWCRESQMQEHLLAESIRDGRAERQYGDFEFFPATKRHLHVIEKFLTEWHNAPRGVAVPGS